MNPRDAALGRVIYRLPFAVQQGKRFVLFVFGGLTIMVSVWVTTMLHSAVFTLEGESHGLFTGILVFFAIFIVVGFNVSWWVLRRYPHALVVRERGLVLEHGPQTRLFAFDEVSGIDQRHDDDGTLVYVVLIADGSDVPFGCEHPSQEAARAIVQHAGLVWSEEPLRAERASAAAGVV